jgi:subtilase family serine protease
MTCDGKSWTQVASSPATDPLVTAVGGTELHAARYCLAVLGCNSAANPSFGTYQGEIAWNEIGQTESTGGGYSKLFSQPPYQKGVLPGGTQRSVPDVAYNAAIYHGVLTLWQGGFWLFGGTSAGSPQMSALIAIADQKAGHDLGFINTALYHMGQNAFYSRSINDVTSGSNSVIEPDAAGNPVSVQGWNAGSRWDAATGLGSPIGDQLVNNLIHFVSPGDATAVLANSTPHGGNVHASTSRVTPH